MSSKPAAFIFSWKRLALSILSDSKGVFMKSFWLLVDTMASVLEGTGWVFLDLFGASGGLPPIDIICYLVASF